LGFREISALGIPDLMSRRILLLFESRTWHGWREALPKTWWHLTKAFINCNSQKVADGAAGELEPPVLAGVNELDCRGSVDRRIEPDIGRPEGGTKKLRE
jgi:hypothetical protein